LKLLAEFSKKNENILARQNYTLSIKFRQIYKKHIIEIFKVKSGII